MRTETYRADTLRKLFRRQKIATLDELKAALGTPVDSTVFRKLKVLSARSSYSHRGRYYTLDEIARFDEDGLWSFRFVWFSICGTLISTVESMVTASEAGYRVDELEDVLHVEVKAPLLKLVLDERLAREKLGGRYLYLASDAVPRKEQLRSRQIYDADPGRLGLGGGVRVLPEELKAAIVLFYSLLDEKQRRLYAGLESLKVGHGGDRRIAGLLGIGVGTIARGREELLRRDVEIEGVRKTGAGRKRLKQQRRRS